MAKIFRFSEKAAGGAPSQSASSGLRAGPKPELTQIKKNLLTIKLSDYQRRQIWGGLAVIK